MPHSLSLGRLLGGFVAAQWKKALLLSLPRLPGVGAVLVGSLQMSCIAAGLACAAWKGMQVGATLTLMYGFVDPSLSLPGGSWSLGLECMFYIVFPLLVVFLRSNIRLSLLVLLGSLLVAVLAQTVDDTR